MLALLAAAALAEPPTEAELLGTWYLFAANERIVRWSCDGGPPRLIVRADEIVLHGGQDAELRKRAGSTVAGEERTLVGGEPPKPIVTLSWTDGRRELAVKWAGSGFAASDRAVLGADRGDVRFVRQCCLPGDAVQPERYVADGETCPVGTRAAGDPW
jgi:hypothetical protein